MKGVKEGNDDNNKKAHWTYWFIDDIERVSDDFSTTHQRKQQQQHYHNL